MKRTYHFINALTILAIALTATGCLKDKVNLPKQNEQDYNQVYMPQAVSTPVVSNLLFKSDPQYLVYGANYGGVGYPAASIPVSFAVAPDSVAAYNTRNNTNYPLLPASSYTMDQLSSTIPGGQLNTPPLKIAVKTEGALDIFKEYLLPVSVNITGNATGIKLNKNLSTTYFLVKASLNLSDFTDYDRANWKVTFFSSQEENGEGPVNGRAALVLDGDINTYWHTRYADYFADPPHILIIDMNEVKTLHGVSFVDRQNQNRGRPMQVTVQTGTNGTDWTTSDDFTLQSTNDDQRYFFLSGFKQARYMKLIIKTMYEGATHTHLAEFGAF